MKKLSTPLTANSSQSLHAGDQFFFNGTIFTGRDAAHKRLAALIEQSKPLPVDLKDQIIYYTGPTPAQPGNVIGSAGPTTSSRMDKYTPGLLAATGLKGIIGKGNRSEAVIRALSTYNCTYFAAIGGAGAFLSRCIKKSELIAYEDLGPEAIYKLEVVNFPVIVAIDCFGKNIYVKGPEEFRLKNGE
jgi:fumarate hydratase subunit beta